MVKSRRRAASATLIDGSPSTWNPVCPRPDFDSRRGRATSIGPSLNTGKARPTGSTRPIAASSRRQRVLGHTEDFEVEVLGMASEQAIADVAADDQRPAATRPGGLGDRCRQCQRCGGRQRRCDGSLTASSYPRAGDVCQNQPVMTTVHRLLRDLVAIDSVNPTLVPGAAGEAAVAMRLVQEFEAIGVPVEIQEVAPGRPNVVATLAGRGSGRSLMLCGHLDTVGVAGMTAPFDAGGA